MSMIVVLHEVLLMVILPMLIPMIKEGFLLIKDDSLVWLACTKAKILQKLCYWKSGTVSRYPGFSGRFWLSYLSSLHNGQNGYNIQKCYPMLLTKIFLKVDMKWSQKVLTKLILKSFKKKMKESSSRHALLWSYFHALLCFDLAMLLLKNLQKTKNFSSTIDSPRFGDKKKKFTIQSLFTITIHQLLFMTLFTPNFCLFKGGCPLCLEQVLVQDFFPRESFF